MTKPMARSLVADLKEEAEADQAPKMTVSEDTAGRCAVSPRAGSSLHLQLLHC